MSEDIIKLAYDTKPKVVPQFYYKLFFQTFHFYLLLWGPHKIKSSAKGLALNQCYDPTPVFMTSLVCNVRTLSTFEDKLFLSRSL